MLCATAQIKRYLGITQEKEEPPQKMAILSKESKIFIKAKLILLKSCLLGLVCLMICRNLRDVPT